MLKKLKDNLYYVAVEKNTYIRDEYFAYVNSHLDEHYKNRLKSWKLLVKLNWIYRILHKTYTPKVTPRSPYMKGAESEAYQRPTAHHFAQDLMQYDIVSFDIFDTLLLRPFSKPSDLFMIVGKRLNRCGFTKTFSQIRIDSEREARNILEKEEGYRECNIYEIYAQVAPKIGISISDGVETEYQCELDYCYANPYMLEVFQILKAMGKRIIIVSDMYFPNDKIAKLLHKCGYDGYEKLYISCDYRCNKFKGNLYKEVLKDYKGLNIVHIGDNRHSDIEMADKLGLTTRYYKNVHEIGKHYRSKKITELIGSAYSGMVNTKLHNGLYRYPFFYEYGYVYGGLYVFGFCNWIHTKATAEGIDKIFFLSRDGDIYKKVFDTLFGDVKTEYIYWSRLANMKYSVIKQNREEFLARFIDYRAFDSSDSFYITLGSLLRTLSLDKLEDILPLYKLNIDTPIVKENMQIIKEFFIDNWETVSKAFDDESFIMQKLIAHYIGESKKIAIIDIGWTGCSTINLRYFINKIAKIDCDIVCWMAAHKMGDTVLNLLDKSLDAYIFSSIHNPYLIGSYHNRNNSKINTPVFEILTQSTSPSFSGVTTNGDMEFEIPEVENYELINQMHKGILDFCKEYAECFKKDSYLYNIPGIDAYGPFSMVAGHMDFIKQNLGNIKIAHNIGGDQLHQRIESFKDQWNSFERK